MLKMSIVLFTVLGNNINIFNYDNVLVIIKAVHSICLKHS